MLPLSHALNNPAALLPFRQVRTADNETCLLLGYTREELKGKSILTLLKPLGEWARWKEDPLGWGVPGLGFWICARRGSWV